MTDMLAFLWPWFAFCGVCFAVIAVFYFTTKMP